MLQCVAMCCSVLLCESRTSHRCQLADPPCVAVRCIVLKCVAVHCSVLQCIAVCCSVFQCVAVCVVHPIAANSPTYTVLQCDELKFSVLRCVAVCKSCRSRKSERASPAVHVDKTETESGK